MNANMKSSLQDVVQYMADIGHAARMASRAIGKASTAQKDQALTIIAERIMAQANVLKQANALDLQAGREKGLDSALLDRLELTDARIESMAEGLRQIASLADPVGIISDLAYRPSGIQVGKMRVPLGVIYPTYIYRRLYCFGLGLSKSNEPFLSFWAEF